MKRNVYYVMTYNPDMDKVNEKLENGASVHKVRADYQSHIVFKVPYVAPEDEARTIKRLKDISPFNVKCALKRAEVRAKNIQIEPVHDWISDNLRGEDLGIRKTNHRLAVIGSWIGEPCGYPRKLMANGVQLVDLT
jgi:hypothetical protein